MFLQETGGYQLCVVAFYDFLDYLCLILAPCHYHDSLGFHDGADAHGDSHGGDLLFLREEFRLYLT